MGSAGDGTQGAVSAMRLRIEHELRGRRRILTLHGELELGTVTLLRRTLEPLLADSPELLVDLAYVRFIDSIGLRALMLLHARCLREARPFAIVAPSRRVLATLALTGLLERLPVLPAEAAD